MEEGQMSEPRTHKLTTGSEACWEPLPGNRLDLYGWTVKLLREGDYILLTPTGSRETRYRLTDIRRPGDPLDMWFGKAEFAPRTAPSSPAPETPHDR
jgi:hypothetical protein